LEQTIFFWRARSSIFLLIPFVKVERTQQISRRFLPPRHFVSSLHFNQTDNLSTIRSCRFFFKSNIRIPFGKLSTLILTLANCWS
jgi:hypothetical protein